MKSILLFISVCVFFCMSCSTETAEPSLGEFERDFFEHLNAYRDLNNANTLSVHTAVQEQALAFATRLANGESDFTHDSFSERALAIKTALRGTNTAECIAYGQSNASELINYWRSNPEYAPHLLGDFNKVGIASVADTNGKYYHVLVLFLAS